MPVIGNVNFGRYFCGLVSGPPEPAARQSTIAVESERRPSPRNHVQTSPRWLTNHDSAGKSSKSHLQRRYSKTELEVDDPGAAGAGRSSSGVVMGPPVADGRLKPDLQRRCSKTEIEESHPGVANNGESYARVAADLPQASGQIKSILVNHGAPVRKFTGRPADRAGDRDRANTQGAQNHIRFSSGVVERELKKEHRARKLIEGANALWTGLAQVRPLRPYQYFSESVIPRNDSGIPCNQTNNVVVNMHGREHRIHANRIDVLPKRTELDRTARQFHVAAQAPQTRSGFEAMLTQAVESGQGIFQIVLPSEHASLAQDPMAVATNGTSISSVLQHINVAANMSGGRFTFGDGYEVMDVKAAYNSHRCNCELTVRKNGVIKNAYLTQVALKFDGAVLQPDAIEMAKKELDYHMQFSTRNGRSQQAAPMMVSHGGVGRNATLIVYHEISEMLNQGLIKSEKHIDALLQIAIVNGRSARGPSFMHSESQLLALRTALFKKWQKQNGQPRMP